MGTDAGTDTSEKAPIGGRTSLTQLDTWLEAMDGETLCLTGKVTDCWQPVDGAQENASFYLKDLSIEADASSFVFSGDSAETTDNLSQISGSADADQMSVLISSQKTISQINEMQEIFGKNASALCYLQEDEALPRAGSYVRVFGEVSPFLQATNPGEFDAAAYYRRKDCLFALRKTKITAQTKTYGRLEEFLSQLRYESEVLFRKLLGEKNGATASAMVLGRKKGMDSEVKALYQGAGISHLLAISGLHLSLIGAGLFGLLKKVRLPVALSAGISTWILIVYAQLTGMGISTRRALVMFLLFLAAGLLKRTPDLPTSLAVAALLLLVPRPQRILDAGFQLSFSAVIGIAVMIPVLQDGWEEAAPSLRVANRVTDGVAGWNIARAAIARACRLLRKNILAGLGITMTMLPFLLIHFYEWSPWSVLLNLAVIPLMGILLPCLIGLQLVARLTAFTHCLELPQHLLCTAIEAIFSCYEQLCRFTTALLAFGGSKFLMTPTYQSVTKIYVLNKQDSSNTNVTYSDLQAGTQLVKDYSELIKSRFVLEAVIEQLGLPLSYEKLSRKVTVSTPADTRVISIAVTNSNPVMAMKIANAIRETASTHICNVMDIEAVNIVETANVPTHKASPSVGKNTMLGGMLGILMVAAIVILSHLMNDTIQTEEDVEKYLGISTLAMIPLNEAESRKKKKKYKKQATSGK